MIHRTDSLAQAVDDAYRISKDRPADLFCLAYVTYGCGSRKAWFIGTDAEFSYSNVAAGAHTVASYRNGEEVV